MQKKVKLDVIEDYSAGEIEMMPEALSEETAGAAEPTKVRWSPGKLLIIVAPALIVVFVITGVLWFYLATKITHQREVKVVVPPLSAEKQEPPKAQAAAPAVAEKEKAYLAFFNDFVINLKDNTGKSRILRLDITFEVKGDMQIDKEINNIGVRNMIYNTARGKNAVAMKSIEERKKLKMELSAELNRMFGEDFVRNVYFTKYVIL